MAGNLDSVFRDLLMLMHWCVLAGGIVVCLMNRYLTRWTWLILIGLGGLLATGETKDRRL